MHEKGNLKRGKKEKKEKGLKRRVKINYGTIVISVYFSVCRYIPSVLS